MLVRMDYEAGESEQAKAVALRYYEAAAPFLAAALPPLHPAAVSCAPLPVLHNVASQAKMQRQSKVAPRLS